MHNLKMGGQRHLHRAKGQAIESACRDFLTQQNILVIATNFHSKLGEIDLIGLENDTLVFFEVRYRSQDTYGSSLESVTLGKQRRIFKTALCFIMQHTQFQRHAYRFDIVGASTYNGQIQFQWQKNAFQVRNEWI